MIIKKRVCRFLNIFLYYKYCKSLVSVCNNFEPKNDPEQASGIVYILMKMSYLMMAGKVFSCDAHKQCVLAQSQIALAS